MSLTPSLILPHAVGSYIKSRHELDWTRQYIHNEWSSVTSPGLLITQALSFKKLAGDCLGFNATIYDHY